jgi:hypothetical protein
MIHDDNKIYNIAASTRRFKNTANMAVAAKSFLPVVIVAYLRAHEMTTFSKAHISFFVVASTTTITITTRKGCTVPYYPWGF